MSYNIRNIREISNDPLTKFVNQLAKKFSTFRTQGETDKLENKEDIYSNAQDIDVPLRINSFTSTNYFDGTVEYFPSFEPDPTYTTLWLRGMSIGNTLQDWTLYRQDGHLMGDVLLIDGTPFDHGLHQGGVKSTAIRFNRPTSDTVNTEYIYVDDNSVHSIDGITTGISYFMRFRVSSLSTQNGLDRGLFAKIDDLTTPDPTNGIMCILTTDGRISVTISRAGVKQEKKTPAASIVVDTVYDLWVIFNDSGDVIKIYLNGVDQTLTNVASPGYSWQNTESTNLRIFRRGYGSTDGYVEGDLYDFRIYREKVVSAAEVGYMYTNKWTIADIAFGHVMIINYWATFLTPGAGYTSIGYSSVGYTT